MAPQIRLMFILGLACSRALLVDIIHSGFGSQDLGFQAFDWCSSYFFCDYVGVSVCILCMGACCVCGFMWVVVLDVCGGMCVCLMWMFWLDELAREI